MTTPLVVPLQAVSSQTLSVTLSGQACKINVYQKSTGLYVDLYVNDKLIVGGVIGLNGVPIVGDTYFGFTGDLGFIDTQGTDDPDSSGLGSRWLLVYAQP